jgi:hypothetical protein
VKKSIGSYYGAAEEAPALSVLSIGHRVDFQLCLRETWAWTPTRNDGRSSSSIMMRVSASAILEDSGYKVVLEPDGAAALVLLQANDQIDLLFTGIVLPGIEELMPRTDPSLGIRVRARYDRSNTRVSSDTIN